MSKDYRNTSKLAIAGLIFAVAAPCLFLLFAILADKGLAGFEDVLSFIMAISPFIALILSIAGVVVSIRKNMKGIIPGTVGLILSIAEIIYFIAAIGNFLTRMQNYNPF
ncbi:MAG: hypothetical protein J5685_04240 [Clostridiales bacterium]|nr:hypothetical protein [Clostridiales bacterium]